ncbi:hypothetical protein E2C01_029917 [Portunus trituberculatus]|uniref:Uncharacterized protein n=1 Tax=Portunus trituberculatus TaxID=210409 RepID=A0A5B7EP55_PORTR|nr:hypothetical protein [Portunus trituberculatus]
MRSAILILESLSSAESQAVPYTCLKCASVWTVSRAVNANSALPGTIEAVLKAHDPLKHSLSPLESRDTRLELIETAEARQDVISGRSVYVVTL